MLDVTLQPSSPTLRESVDEPSQRIPPTAFVKLTEDLERDLLLSSTQLEMVHDRAVLELSWLRDSPSSQ